MAVSQTNMYKNEKRNHQKSLTREGMFVSDYVYTKYNCIYQEAAVLYNQINEKNPRKPDLRKTVEYRRWKNNLAALHNMPLTPVPRQKKRQLIHMVHRDIPIDTTGLPVITCIDLPTVEIPLPDQTPPSSENPVPENPSAENPVPENPSSDDPPENPPLDKRIGGMTMQLNIPLIQVPTSSSKTVQYPEEILTTACEEITIDEGDQTEVLDPSILDEVSPETMSKIIEELQRDPNLKDIMVDIENNLNIEEELVGLTVDLPDLPDPLEEELMFW